MANTPKMMEFTAMPNKSFAINPPFFVDAKVLAAGTASTETIPSDASGRKANLVIMSSNGDFYAAYQQTGDGAPPTATVPAANVADGSACELNPAGRLVQNLSGISVISASATIITFAYYIM